MDVFLLLIPTRCCRSSFGKIKTDSLMLVSISNSIYGCSLSGNRSLQAHRSPPSVAVKKDIAYIVTFKTEH